MSGQYPGSYNNPMTGHRNQFNAQQQQQMMNQMQMGGGGVGMTGAGNMLPLGYNQGNIMTQQQQQQQQQQVNPMQQQGMQAIPGPAGGVMNPVGMQSPSHVQQQLLQQQLQMQQQQQQQQMGAVGSQMGMVGQSLSNSSQVGNIMQQQQQQQQQIPPLMVQQQNQIQSQPQSVQAPPPSQQQQQQQMAQTSGQAAAQQPTNNAMLSISQQPHKEINIVTLSRVGQETVQDITSRFQEIFAALKIIQPTANRDNHTVKKVQEHFRTIRLLFKRMRLIYERCNDGYPQGMEFSTVETSIPFKDEPEHRSDTPQCEEYRKALQENQELIDTVKLKNRQLREIIDRTRIIVWEINTMLSMRRS